MRSHTLGRSTRCCAKPIGESLDGISEITEQVPAISDLNNARRALTNAVGINTGSITCDNLDTWVIAQPSGHRCGVAVRQEINHFIRLKVHEYRAVSMTTPPCPVVDPEDPRRCGSSRWRVRRHQAKQRVRAGRNRKTSRQPRSGFAAERETEMMVKIAQSSCLAAETPSHFGQGLGKSLAGAVAIGASEAAHGDTDRHRPSLPRQVVEHPAVNAVNPSRGCTTARTFRHRRARHGLYCDPLGGRKHAYQSERARDEGEQGRGHRLSTMDVSPGLSSISPPRTSLTQHAECGRT